MAQWLLAIIGQFEGSISEAKNDRLLLPVVIKMMDWIALPSAIKVAV